MAAGSGAVRAGRAFVEFFADSNMLYRGMGDIQKKLTTLGVFTAKTGAGMATAGLSITAPLAKVFTDAAGRGRDISSLAKQFNVSTESISALAGGFEGLGVNLDGFGGILDSLSGKFLANDELLRQLRLNTQSLAKMPIDQALGAIADKFTLMTDSQQKASVASELFGSNWRQILPYLEQGAAGIAKLKQEGKDAGSVIDAETARRGVESMKALNQVWTQLKFSILEVGNALLPTTDQIKSAVTWVKAVGPATRDWISQNKAVVQVTFLAGTALLATGTALAAFGTVAAGAAATIGFVGSVFGGIVSTVTSLPAILTVAGAGLVGYFGLQTDMGKRAVASLKEGFTSLKDIATSTWSDITTAVVAGDLPGAFKIATTAVQSIWDDFAGGIREKWDSLIESIGGSEVFATLNGVVKSLTDSAKQLAPSVYELAKAWGTIRLTVLTAEFNVLIGVLPVLAKAIESLTPLIVSAGTAFADAVSSVAPILEGLLGIAMAVRVVNTAILAASALSGWGLVLVGVAAAVVLVSEAVKDLNTDLAKMNESLKASQALTGAMASLRKKGYSEEIQKAAGIEDPKAREDELNRIKDQAQKNQVGYETRINNDQKKLAELEKRSSFGIWAKGDSKEAMTKELEKQIADARAGLEESKNRIAAVNDLQKRDSKSVKGAGGSEGSDEGAGGWFTRALEKAKAAAEPERTVLSAVATPDRESMIPKLPGKSDMLQLADKVKGTFSGQVAAQQLGIGDTVAQRQLDGINKVATNTGAMPELAAAMTAIATALRSH